MAFHRNGVRLPTFDARDFIFQPAAMGLRDNSFPPSHRLVVPFDPWNQGRGTNHDVPCCVSCAIVAAMEILDAQKVPSTRLSVLFHYYRCRPNKNRLGELEIRSGLWTAAVDGVCDLALHLPDSADTRIAREAAKIEPTPKAIYDAKDRTILHRDRRTRRAR